MCGRYTYLYTWEELQRLMTLIVPEEEAKKRYNIAPTQRAPVIRISTEGEAVIQMLRWGLIPPWAKDLKIGYTLINARCETITIKPSFSAAFKSRRCLVPASGYYEWRKFEDKNKKQTYYIRPRNNDPIVFAGIWESWESTEEESIESYSIITTESSSLIQPLHERMPVILNQKEFGKWLDPKASIDELIYLLKPCEQDLLRIYPVSSHVNSSRYDDAECIAELFS